jgi:hypothetical protein
MAARVLGDDGCVARWRHEISSRGQQWRCEISYRVELCQPWLAGIVEDEHCTATRRVSDRAQVGEGDGSDSREEGERVERTAVNHLVCLSAQHSCSNEVELDCLWSRRASFSSSGSPFTSGLYTRGTVIDALMSSLHSDIDRPIRSEGSPRLLRLQLSLCSSTQQLEAARPTSSQPCLSQAAVFKYYTSSQRLQGRLATS